MILGMCGGYQMLGQKIYDPDGVESPRAETDGLALLDIETTFRGEKHTCRLEATPLAAAWGMKGGYVLKGYEIHMGESRGDTGMFSVKRVSPSAGPKRKRETRLLDGSEKGNCWGTYIHGIFDNDLFRRDLINALRVRKGLLPLESRLDYSDIREKAIDNLAVMVKEHVDMKFIGELLSL
jgi:adenosylcobyric acid synthase